MDPRVAACVWFVPLCIVQHKLPNTVEVEFPPLMPDNNAVPQRVNRMSDYLPSRVFIMYVLTCPSPYRHLFPVPVSDSSRAGYFGQEILHLD